MTTPGYDFKLLPELAWAAGIAFAVYALTAFVQSQDVVSWQDLGVAIVTGGARAAAGAALAAIARRRA